MQAEYVLPMSSPAGSRCLHLSNSISFQPQQILSSHVFHSENDTNRLSDPQVSFEFIWRRSKGWVFTLTSLNKFVIGWYIESFTC